MLKQSSPQEDIHLTNTPQPLSRFKRLFVLLLLVGLTAATAWFLGDELSLRKLADREAALQTFQTQSPLLVYVAAFLVYVIVAGLSLPGAAGLTLLLGWLFGFWRGMIVASFASTAGATVAFFLSRYLLRDFVTKRFGDRLNAFNEALLKEGAFYLFTLRLVPAVPFFAINAVMGLTPMPARTFWWVSQIGMLPGTAVFVYAGASVPRLQVLAERGIGVLLSSAQITQLFIAFTLLGFFPLIGRFILQRFARTAHP